MFVCQRERERERETDTQRERERERGDLFLLTYSIFRHITLNDL